MKTSLMSLYIEIICRCNEKCMYCYNGEHLTSGDRLSFKQIKKLIDQAQKYQLKGMTLSGGEPLLHPEIDQILEYAHLKGIEITVITNAVLLDEEKAKLFAKYQVDLQLTLDSGIEALNDHARGKGTYAHQQRALDLLKNNGYQGAISLRSNLWDGNDNEESIGSVIAFCHKNNIRFVKFALAHMTEYFREAICEEEKINLLGQWIKAYREQNKDLKIEFGEEDVSLGCPYVVEQENLECGLRIRPNGDVYPCQLFDSKQFVIGNIYRNTLEEILKGKPLERFVSVMLLRKHFIPECTACGYQSLCFGGCPAKAYLENHNIFTAQGQCHYRRKILKDGLGEVSMHVKEAK